MCLYVQNAEIYMLKYIVFVGATVNNSLYFCQALFFFRFQLHSSFPHIINHSFRPACSYALKTEALVAAETLVAMYEIHFAKSKKTVILSCLSLRKVVREGIRMREAFGLRLSSNASSYCMAGVHTVNWYCWTLTDLLRIHNDRSSALGMKG